MRKALMMSAGIVMAAFLAACGSGVSEDIVAASRIDTPQGPVIGVSTDTDGIYNYKGLPFAAPPVGDLRWAEPGPAPSWTDVKTADTFGNRCMQPTDTEGGFFAKLIDGHDLGALKSFAIKRVVAAQKPSPISEDCLYLNVRTGNPGSADKRPVMVWIHGGGHQFGSGDFAYYQANGLVERDVVLVTLNYRLGVFGYMAHPALSESDPRGVSGNYGALDQIAALHWVENNISAYGGDPDNVTIFGESAGGWSVTEMMASPLAAGLFDKAIAQSGSATYHFGQMADGKLGEKSGYDVGREVEAAVGLTNATAAQLRSVDADTLIANLPEKSDQLFHHVRDGVVFPKNVGVAFRDGDINAVPYLTGYNADEGTLFYYAEELASRWSDTPLPEDPVERRDVLDAAYPGQARILDGVYRFAEDGFKAGEAMMGDEIFGVQVRLAARQNAAQGQPSWLYHFSRVPPGENQTIGAFHAAEIPFVFDSSEPILGLTDEDAELTDIMVSAWTNFAKTGNPNGPGVPKWPEHAGENWLHLSANTDRPVAAVETHIRQQKLDALEVGTVAKLDALEAEIASGGSGSGVASD